MAVFLPFTLLSIVVCFVPFADGSFLPWDEVTKSPRVVLARNGRWTLGMAGLSFFLWLPILAWKAQLWLACPPSRSRIAVFTTIAAISSVPVISVLLWVAHYLLTRPGIRPEPLVSFTVAMAALATGVAAGAWLWSVGRRPRAVLIWLLCCYLANASFCLLALHDDLDVGGALTILVAAATAAEAIYVFLGRDTPIEALPNAAA